MNVKNLLAVAALLAPLSAQAYSVKVTPITVNGGVKSPIIVGGQLLRINSLNTNLGLPLLSPTFKPTVLKVNETPAVGFVAAQQAFEVLSANPSMQALTDKSEAAQGNYGATLNNVYEKSGTGVESNSAVSLSEIGSGSNNLAPNTGNRSFKSQPGVSKLAVTADNAGGAGLGSGLRRLWDVTIGKFLRWVGGVEKKNAKALAAGIVDELDRALPEMNAAAAEIGKTAHLLKKQIDKDTAESAKYDKLIDQALKMNREEDAKNLLTTKTAIDNGLAATQEQYAQAKANQEAALKKVKDFYWERQKKLQQIQNLLSRDEMATMNKRMNELQGKFKIGDLGAKIDKLEQIVNENEAEVEGQNDVINNSGETAQKEIEDAINNSEINDEIARRKAKLNEGKK